MDTMYSPPSRLIPNTGNSFTMMAVMFLYCTLLAVTTLGSVLFTEGTNRTEHVCDKKYRFTGALPLVSQVVMASPNIKHLFIITQLASDEADDFVKLLTELRPMHIAFADTRTFSAPTASLMTALLERQILQHMWSNLNFLVIGSYQSISAVIHEAQVMDMTLGRRSLLRHFSRWILIPTDDNMTAISVSEVVLDNVNIVVDLEKCIENPWNMTNGTVMLSLYWQSHGREWQVLSEQCLTEAPFPNTKYGLNGRNLLVSALEWLSFLKKDVVNGTLTYSGVSDEILNKLGIAHNFSITYKEPGDNKWGEDINGSWTGIVGMIQRMEVDICGVPYAMNIERGKVMTFTYSISEGYQSAVYKKSADINKHWHALTSCFKWEVYLLGLVTFTGVCGMIFFFESIDPRKLRTTHTKRNLNVAEIVMVDAMVSLHQCSSRLPRSSPSKVLLSAWWFFCIIITSVYTGNIIAFLTVSKEYLPFRTLEDITQQSQYAVGVSSGGIIELILRTSNDSQMKKIWQMAKKSKVNSDVSKGDETVIHINRLRAGHYILLLDSGTVNVLLTQECGITKLPENFIRMYASFTFPKYSPLALLFNDELIYLTESGLIATWNRMWSPKPKTCTDAPHVDKRQLNSDDLLSALVAVGIGITIAGFALLCEIRGRRYLTRNKANTSTNSYVRTARQKYIDSRTKRRNC